MHCDHEAIGRTRVGQRLADRLTRVTRQLVRPLCGQGRGRRAQAPHMRATRRAAIGRTHPPRAGCVARSGTADLGFERLRIAAMCPGARRGATVGRFERPKVPPKVET